MTQHSISSLRILLIGNTGQLGWELQRTLAPLGEVEAFDYPSVDLLNVESTRQLVRQCQPDLIVNAAAYTAVDRAEAEPDLAHAVNAIAPGVLAEEALHLGAALIHYSTDYVFDGLKAAPYVESDSPNPLSVYGRTKLEGELEVQQAGGAYIILRTSWVYSLRGDSFVNKVLRWSRSEPLLKLVADQVSSPTWARMLAEVTALVLAKGSDLIRERTGLYHLAGGGYASRFEWAQEILKLDPNRDQQAVKHLLPAATRDFPTPAQRPLFSALDCSHFENTFGLCLPAWKDSLSMGMESDRT